MGNFLMRMFPVLHPPPGCARSVPWSALDDEWARHIHAGQSLETLAKRGGMCAEEIYANATRGSYSDLMAISLDDAVAFVNDLVREGK